MEAKTETWMRAFAGVQLSPANHHIWASGSPRRVARLWVCSTCGRGSGGTEELGDLTARVTPLEEAELGLTLRLALLPGCVPSSCDCRLLLWGYFLKACDPLGRGEEPEPGSPNWAQASLGTRGASRKPWVGVGNDVGGHMPLNQKFTSEKEIIIAPLFKNIK